MSEINVKTDFVKLIHRVLTEIFQLREIHHIVAKNIVDNKGKEEELYPYFNRVLLGLYLKCVGNIEDIYGIGYGELCKKKIDCLLIIRSNDHFDRYAIEIKGPSHDKSYVCRGISDDKIKLKELKNNGDIVSGWALGLLLHELGTNKSSNGFDCILKLQCGEIGVKFIIEAV